MTPLEDKSALVVGVANEHSIAAGCAAAFRGIARFDELIDAARLRAPEQSRLTVEDVGDPAVMLASDGAHRDAGDTASVDGGFHVRT